MASAGAVNWLFEKKGFFVIDKSKIGEDKLMAVILDAGAEDLSGEEETYEVRCQPSDYEKVKQALDENGVACESAELTMIPKSTVKVEGDSAKQVLRLVEQLEDNDDVQNVYANFDIPEDILKEDLEQNS